jgi:hypothetical protein
MVSTSTQTASPAPRRLDGARRALALCGLSLLLLGAGSYLPDERIIRNFDIVVFQNEYREGTSQNLRKWAAPIRILVDSRAGSGDLHKRLVEAHVAQLVDITGYDIAIVEDRSSANVVAVFERSTKIGKVLEEFFPDADRAAKIFSSSLCMGRYYVNGHFEIVKGVVIIPSDRSASLGRLPACVVEEITQVLGLPNDSAEVYPSIFNDKSIDMKLTRHDILLLRLFFDPRLRPGMDRTEVLDLVRRILPDLRH